MDFFKLGNRVKNPEYMDLQIAVRRKPNATFLSCLRTICMHFYENKYKIIFNKNAYLRGITCCFMRFLFIIPACDAAIGLYYFQK